jgi:peptide/nickel transport system permease protein
MVRTRSIVRSGFLVLAGVELGLVVLAAIFAPLITPFEPNVGSLPDHFIRPMELGERDGLRHILGTDYLGRDVLCRILYGSRVALIVAVSATMIGGSVGIPLGLLAGYFGGWPDRVISGINEVFLAFPVLLLALTLTAAFGSSLQNVIIALSIASWPTYARLARGLTVSETGEGYIQSAFAVGCSHWRVILRHIAPNMISPILVLLSLEASRVIIMEGALSYLGVGVPLTTVSWGGMISAGQPYIFIAPWIIVCPAIAIISTVLAINVIADALRDRLDPRFVKLK